MMKEVSLTTSIERTPGSYSRCLHGDVGLGGTVVTACSVKAG